MLYDRGEWAPVHSQVANPASTDAMATVLVSFRNAPGIYFGSRAWVPAESRRYVVTLLSTSVLPEGVSKTGEETQVQLIDEAGGRSTQRASQIGILSVREPGMRPALSSVMTHDDSRQFHAAMLQAAEAGRTSFTMSRRSAPADAASIAALDMITLSDPAGFTAAQAKAIRHWVNAGGRLWIMLDETGPELPASILGEDWRVTTLGRVELSRYEIRGHGDSHAMEHDYPTQFVMTHAGPGVEVLMEAEGYPAAMRWAVGEGQVMVTTLAPQGWLDDKGAPSVAMEFIKPFVPNPQARRTTSAERAERDIAHLMPQVSAQVGYRVPSRAVVGGVLAVFLMGVLVTGLWMLSRGRMEWTAPLAVVMAFVASGVMVTFGWVVLRQTPGVMGSTTRTILEPAADTASLAGMLTAYRRPGSPRTDTLVYHGPPPVPSGKLFTGGARLIKIDRDVWSLENINLAPGEAHTFPVAGAVEVTPARVVGSLTEDAVELRWMGDPGGTLEDLLFVTGRGRLAVRSMGDGKLRAAFSDVLPAGQFIQSGVLSQQQMEHAAVYAQLLEDGREIERPMLIGWRDQAPIRVEALDDTEARHADLLMVPVQFDRPEPGQTLRVPSALMSMSSYRNPRLGVSSTAYDAANGVWLPNLSGPQTVMMRYTLPANFRAMQPQRIDVRITLTSPGRPYEVVTVAGGKLHVAYTGSDASGQFEVQIDDPSMLEITPDGEVLVGVRVMAGPATQENRAWTLSRLDVDVIGRMLPE